MAGKRINLAELADEPPLEEARVPGFTETPPRPPRVEQVAANPLNTRDISARPAKITSIAKSIVEHGQLQPCTVVTRTAFLAIFPEHEAAVDGVAFVQVTGGRRRAAIIEAGLPTIDITVKNDLASSRGKFISATAAENIDREDYDPIEEARAVQLLVEECGTGQAAAEQLGRTPAWVTQRRNLLKLAPQLQEALRADETEDRIPLREVRDLHKLPVEEQLAALEAWRERRSAGLTAVNQDGDDDPPASPATKVPSQRPSPTASAIRRLGGTPSKIAATLRAELPAEDLRALIEELLRED
ncbi:ParB/RepB/Spo0J family partition protein [Dactylosporangium sucinum]|uniref:Uncharacterized protein n=1 Tax=Dactylosporangium sucinum TaxID=1424081 RepID=A0A917TGY8_9ACTN|nr:ParB/RepB/Spo0J family partition protein [Dactylosporangium sucinum]GGM22270.1 hypothetical protein GCM10007977_024290 [Dactylosporangium sucinum]